MRRQRARGFSLVEMMIVLLILMVLGGAIFRLVNMATARSSTEQTKLDMFQEAREFMDQMSRDLREAGYPNVHNFTSDALKAVTPIANNRRVAVGLVRVAADELWFEGDVDGTGTVSVVHYYLDPSTTNNCPCLRRSQLPKIDGNPYTDQTAPALQMEVQNVLNTSIFSAYQKGQTGTAVTLPLNFNDNAVTMANIDTIQAVLTVQASVADSQTRVKSINTLATSVKLNNCSLAASSELVSCF